METVPERLEPPHDPRELYGGANVAPGSVESDDSRVNASPAAQAPELPRAGRTRRPVAPRAARRRRETTAARHELLWVAAVYLGTRVMLLVAAFLQSRFGHHQLLNELANWDGLWYREVANHGYLTQVSHGQTTLGFFPLFPITIWIVEPLFSVLTGQGAIWSATVAGVVVSGIGGYLTTVVVYRLAAGWWDTGSARRATILFCLFPGSVVFSMVYSEGVLLPLAAGCIYALERRRWLLAGILAGLATAVQPTGLVLIAVCGVSAGLELRRRGWNVARAQRVLLAPVLSVFGISAFALFLWAWTGTPLANYEAQHYGWKEKTDPLAMVHLTTRLAGELSLTHLNEPTINLNLVLGLFGAIVLVGLLGLMVRSRREVSIEAMVWTFGIAFLALTSEYVPPNPRMLITAFPAILVAGHYLKGRWFTVAAWANGGLLVLLSLLTFVGTTLRP